MITNRLVLVVFTLVFSFGVVLTLMFSSRANAQVPSGNVPCDEERDPEFNSSRPYQASPCNKEKQNVALFCGNKMTLTDSVSASIPQDPNTAPNCRRKPDSGWTCSFSVSRVRDFAIDLSEAELPILGNTEDTKNSGNSTDNLTDAQKVNEYVSWYLDGVTYKAESGINLDSEEGDSQLVNFSGPIRKLLPRTEIFERQIETVNNLGDSSENQHNQIVVCADRQLNVRWQKLFDSFALDTLAINAPVWIQRFLSLKVIPDLSLRETAKECYSGSDSSSSDAYRIDDWDPEEKLSPFVTIANNLTDFIVGVFASIFPNLDAASIKADIGDRWDQRIPPLEDNPKFKDRIHYLKAYNEWRGKACVLVPVPFVDRLILNKDVKFLFCLENFLVPNKYADLFAYVPLASKEDRVGDSYVKNTAVATSSDVTLSNVNVVSTSADLYFSHIEETKGLTEILQSTYLPEGISGSSPAKAAPGVACSVANVRSNPGDDLFAGEIKVNLSYTASFECDFEETGSGKCSKDVSVDMETVTRTPEIDDIWNRLVDGSSSVFRRIFPKVGIDGAVAGILDIPASTTVKLTGSVTGSEELYFPHIGGIHEYFLKGIQTMLRPKGYGEQILSGTGPKTDLDDDEERGDINCNQNAKDPGIPGLIDRNEFYELVLRLVLGKPGTNADVCFNDAIAQAKAAGVNLNLTLLLWALESNASNYNLTDLDFGVISAPGNDFNAQIAGFLGTAQSHATARSTCAPGTTPMQSFAYVYSSGFCDPNAQVPGFGTAGDYLESLKTSWSWVTSCPFPNSPTDTSCP